MAGSLQCLLKADIGDVAQVCLRPDGFDIDGRPRWKPSNVLTPDQFSFIIIGKNPDRGLPIIGVPRQDRTYYGFTPDTTPQRLAKYNSSYILIPSDIKTVKIYKR